MPADQKAALEKLSDQPLDQEQEGIVNNSDEWVDFGGIVDGSEEISVSHAGGEFQELARQFYEDLRKSVSDRAGKRVDYRTRRDRGLRRDQTFLRQLPAMVDAYLEWSYRRDRSGRGSDTPVGEKAEESVGVQMRVIDVFDARTIFVTEAPTDKNILATLVRHGLVPCSPCSPNVSITIDALELLRISRVRCPHYSIQAFTKTLCDLHGVAYQRYLTRQVTIAFDVYQQVLHEVRQRVNRVLERDKPDWRLKHVCPACTYNLQDEKKLRFDILYTMDGNDSLKRIYRRSSGEDNGADADICPSAANDLPTAFQLHDDRYIPREIVDKWAVRNGRDLVTDESAEVDENNPCASRWKNMKDDKTKRMWGIFDETGLFGSVCRHGFSLVIADMVRSGELAKYPLAVVEKMLHVYKCHHGCGYDIGCRFKTILAKSGLGKIAKELNHTCLVGAFHGHAHRRLCQVIHLATYVKGLGIEDLEGCERLWSKLNALAASVRYASPFHRQQAIVAFLAHHDTYEMYANLTLFLLNNYKQALNTIKTSRATVTNLMSDLNVTDTAEFERWLEDEKVYLEALQQEPVEESLRMEYWQRAVNLKAYEQELAATRDTWHTHTPQMAPGTNNDTSKALKTAHRHALQKYEKERELVHDLEKRLGISETWTPDSPEWQETGRLVGRRKYQRALDTLEGLIVARVFELGKMNRSQTGYALRQHIGKALKVRSAAIRTALDRFNAAARALGQPTVKWEDVTQYRFLADIDLLRRGRQDVSKRAWSTPAARYLMDESFKILRAEEEIDRLNVEVRRVATYLRDEMEYLHGCEERARPTHPFLAHQIALLRGERDRFTQQHADRLHQIANLEGFTGTIEPGTSVHRELGESAGPIPYLTGFGQFGTAKEAIPPEDISEGVPNAAAEDDDVDVDDDGEDEQEREDTVLTAVMSILGVSDDADEI
ncbi:hypothetical protein CONPUDRAFT_163795 [Coniophora puteana RWD-64-598 SS2]|uniref:CxC1-like cysteine cluster associated with KDZ transposases domain-containing protein n=1 Tax=Coniophora puteana (strain RWD-64-598) TaxID=741705 RepID=A0A5M3MUC3_CONPW|nr:uncharacterized protein CONPUDRAFT_163795 [Coniophora puteana RWD-64-598 SS2]EIW82713.1 hypothetical protein CONPUDRAFT_163795 [Coniophora puteana RWD-64-598 SS2]